MIGNGALRTHTDDMPMPSAVTAAWAGAGPRVEKLRTRTRIALGEPLAAGFVGSLLIALGALSIGIAPKPDIVSSAPLVGLFRTSLLGRGLGTAAVIAGVALMLSVWLSVGRDIRAGIGPGVAQLRRMFWVWAAPMVLALPLFSRDLYSYAAVGNMTRHGYDPYKLGPFVIPGPFADSVDPMWATTPTPYGPVFLWMAGGVSRLTGDSVYLGLVGMRILALVGIWLMLRYLPRLASCCRVDPTAALWLAVLNPLTFMHFVIGGHNDALMIGLLVAGLALALEGNPLMGSVAMALAAGVKAPAAVLLGITGALWARRLGGDRLSPTAPVGRDRLFLGYALAGITALLAFAALTWVTGVGYGWVAALDTPGSVRTWLSPPTAVGMFTGGISSLFGLGATTWELVDLSRRLASLLAVGLIAWLYLRSRPIDPVRGAALILFLLVALGPVVQPWYLMWALIPLAAGGIRDRSFAPWRSAGTARRSWPRVTEAGVVMGGIVGFVVMSQVGGGIMLGPFGVPGTIACLVATTLVVGRALTAERRSFGAGNVFDLAALRPGGEAGLPDAPVTATTTSSPPREAAPSEA